jgi:hypothetical protein
VKFKGLIYSIAKNGRGNSKYKQRQTLLQKLNGIYTSYIAKASNLKVYKCLTTADVQAGT